MSPIFARLVESLEPKHHALVNMKPVRYATLPRVLPLRGIYLFSEGDDHHYVGRTKHLRRRLRGHCIPSASHFTATFAFRLAREKTGKLIATYVTAGSRPDLLNEAAFALAFSEAKLRIASMDIRFVEEIDPTCQALLEIYSATVLGTKYNDFNTH